ncbi:hypothetical protein TNCV_1766761 [Trichonephila clavipes]|nr:hypothetical protein TNCV_1766761 [Trichonephila clavipes]
MRFYLGIWTGKIVLNPISGQVFYAGHDESGGFLSAEWHDGDWLVDGIREAWLRCLTKLKLDDRGRRRRLFPEGWEKKIDHD